MSVSLRSRKLTAGHADPLLAGALALLIWCALCDIAGPVESPWIVVSLCAAAGYWHDSLSSAIHLSYPSRPRRVMAIAAGFGLAIKGLRTVFS
jgi:hypothetical protein